MINYFLYRIQTNYDGFCPSKIPLRAGNGKLKYNWKAYFDSVDKGDIILTFFTGSSCKKGIYALARVSNFHYNEKGNLVTGKIISSSIDDTKPLIDYEGNRELFDRIFKQRARGAEFIIPEVYEKPIFELVARNKKLLNDLEKNHLILPGAPNEPICDVTEIPKIKSFQMNRNLTNNGFIPTFWIKPRQASWVHKIPPWLEKISKAFSKFKAGDLSMINEFADAMEDQIRNTLKNDFKKIGLITGVPLNLHKLKNKEIDRVGNLATALAERVNIKYKAIFSLSGKISRRFYKNNGYDENAFVKDYLKNLYITKNELIQLSKKKKKLLLVDDVLTDGITTKTIVDACKNIQGTENLEIIIATLGLMTKKSNLSNSFIKELE